MKSSKSFKKGSRATGTGAGECYRILGQKEKLKAGDLICDPRDLLPTGRVGDTVDGVGCDAEQLIYLRPSKPRKAGVQVTPDLHGEGSEPREVKEGET